MLNCLYMSQAIAPIVVNELFGSILLFPVWWYTRGLRHVLTWAKNFMRDANESYALSVWIKNLFVPMYGDSEWSGRVLSFFVRCGLIAVRGGAVLVWCALAIAAVGLYVVALPIAALGILFHSVGFIF